MGKGKREGKRGNGKEEVGVKGARSIGKVSFDQASEIKQAGEGEGGVFDA